ncbi:uncharacterized protein [Antedon mediterranea]|uniref:uncharacterized protein n=1 Tax=Antedon mediterranea TaxID=105859 RepID=UPI003AF510CD
MAELLIMEVQKYPELYDRTHPQHKNVERKQEIWELLGHSLQTTGIDASKRWKDIRDSFVKSRRRLSSPKNPNKVYKPYRHARLLDFLLPCLLTSTNSKGKKRVSTTTLLENGGDGDTAQIMNDDLLQQPEKKIKKYPKVSLQEDASDLKETNANKEELSDLDEDDLFFRSMACSCKKLPQSVKSFVRFKIHEIIFQAENQIIAVSEISQPPVTSE